MKVWLSQIKRMGACKEALVWGEQYDTIGEAWANCERGNWMLWLCGKLSGSYKTQARKKLVLAACECARLALPYVARDKTRPLKAIETAELWAMGKKNITLTMVKKAAAAAASAAAAAYLSPYAAAASAAAAAAAAAFAAAASAADDAYLSPYAAAASAAAAAAAAAFAAAAYAAAAAFAAAASADNAAAAYAAYAPFAAARRREVFGHCADIVRKHYPDPPDVSQE